MISTCKGCSFAELNCRHVFKRLSFLSAEGELYTCLFAAHGRDLRGPLREGATDEQLAALLGRIWGNRGDRYSELRSAETRDRPRVEMSHIGG